MGSKLTKVYYSPQSHLKGLAAIQELVEATKVPEKNKKQWLIKQTLWQIYLPTLRYIPYPKYHILMPNVVY